MGKITELQKEITFVVPVNNGNVFRTNFEASPALRNGAKPNIIVQEGFRSAAQAYNDAIRQSASDLIVFAHQDVILPEHWLFELRNAVERLDSDNPNWGVLGCWGVKSDGSFAGHIYSTGLGILGRAFDHPVRVQTLDEVVLILRKSSGIRFDERIGGYHFYGSAVCMAASLLGRVCYAIPAFCIHNTEQLLTLPPSFYECYREFRQVWRDSLPVYTSCIRVSRLGWEMYFRRWQEFLRQWGYTARNGKPRSPDPAALIESIQPFVPDQLRVPSEPCL